MQKMEGIYHRLDMLNGLSPSGCAIALHIENHVPKLMFRTYPVAWLKYYEENNFILSDPVVVWGFGTKGTCRWSEMEELDARGVLKQAKNYGMNFGFVSSIGTNDEHSIGWFSRPDREYSDAEISEMTKILEMIHKEEISAIMLTDKQKTLLKALANDARIEDVSRDLGIPVGSVKSQLTDVGTLLGTRTGAEAVQRATDLELLK